MQERERLSIEIFPIPGQPPTSIEPRNRSFDDPSFGQHDEGVQFVALDDLNRPGATRGGSLCRVRSLVARVCEDAQNEREQGACSFVEHESRAIAILHMGGMNGGAQQQAERVYEKMALFALDLLSCVVAMRIVRPPFSALFTLWLSMMAAVGLASCSSCSLHST